MTLKIGLLGGGSWGTTVAAIATRNAPVTLWARDAATVEDINANRRNNRYLPDLTLPAGLRASCDIGEVVAQADVIVMGVPSHSFRAVLEDVAIHIRPWVPVLSLTKGLELSTGKRMTELVVECLPGHPVGVLTGPNLAREILSGQAAASVISMEDEIIVRRLQGLFHSGLFRVYTNTDLIGCELGGVLKNIIAIAVGMSDGRAHRNGRPDRHLHQPAQPQPQRRGGTGQGPHARRYYRLDAHGRRRRQKRADCDGPG
jgi:glycerol-3-phosphate dehydrogenase (NAD(P)+)